MSSSMTRSSLRLGRTVRDAGLLRSQTRTLALAIAAASIVGVLSQTAAAQLVYVGASGGDWGAASNWSPASVPTSADDVTVDNRAGNFTVLTGVSATDNAHNLKINSGDAVELSNNSTLNLGGDLSGTGTLRFNVASNRAILNFTSAAAMIASGSVIDFNYQGGTSADGAINGPGSGTLSNNGTIRGSGTLNNIRFTNISGGVLENYQTSAQLYLDANNNGTGLFVNQGTIRALAGSLVTFTGDNGGDFNNTGGQIQANGAGAVVRLINGASITGGTYSTSGGGQIVVEAGHGATATSFANSGLFVLRNNSALNVSGTITNTGTINFTQPYTNESFIHITGDTTLTGAGVVQMDWSGAAGAPAGVIDGNGTLTIAAAQTIRGVGSLRNLRVNNAGLIDATSGAAQATGGGIYLDANNNAPGLFTNTGTIRSSGGGLLVFSGDNGGDYVNTGGTIAAVGSGSVTELYNSASITGGTLTTSGGGLIRVRPGQTGYLNGPITLTSGTKLSVPGLPNAGTSLTANGTFTNTGSTIELNAAGTVALLNLNGDLTINGGTLSGLYTNVSNSPGPRIDTSGHKLTIAAATTAQGVIFFNNAQLTNNGTINATDPNGIYADSNNSAAGQFVNNGLMEATGGGLLTFTGDNGGDFVNTGGTISSIGTNSIVELYNSASITGGTFTTSGGGVLRVRTGQSGFLNGPITLTSGSKISVPATTAGSTGLNVNGTINAAGATLEFSAAGNVSLLNLNGDLTVNGGTISGLYTNVNNSPGPRIDTGGNTLTLSSTAVVQGVMFFNNARVVNNGIINANDPAGMSVDPSNQGGATDLFVNNGTMEATNGGLMVLTGDFGGGLKNANGTLLSSGVGSLLELSSGVVVNGGTLSTTNGGTLRVRLGQTANLNGPITISAGSKFSVPTSASTSTSLNVAGTFTNNGTIELNTGGNAALLSLSADCTLNGTGTVNAIDGNTAGAGPRIDTGSNTLTIGANQTVAGVLFFNNARVVNNGTILANSHVVPTAVGQFDMYIDASNQGGATSLFVNNGTIHASNNAAIGLTGDNGGGFSGTGAIVVDAGSIVGSWNGATGNLGPVSGAGTYRASNSSNLGHMSFRVSTLEAINSATARITAGGGTTGTSKVTTLTLNSDGRLDLTDHAIIVDSGSLATIRSQIASGRNNGNWNGPGINSSAVTPGSGYAIGYAQASQIYPSVPTTFLGQPISAGSILVRFTVNGDANLDGKTDFADLLALAKNYNKAGVWYTGDFDYSDTVDFGDLLLLAKNYNASAPSAAEQAQVESLANGASFAADFALAQSMVPEPTTAMSLLALVAAATPARRRR